MVLADVREVAEGAVDLVERQTSPSGPSRFDRLKQNYKGVLSILDVDDGEVSYNDFNTMLEDHKVCVRFSGSFW